MLGIVVLVLMTGCSKKSPYIKQRAYEEHSSRLHKSKDLFEFNKARRRYLTQKTRLQEQAAKLWGNDVKIASRYEYVKYSKNYKARALINFQTGTIQVETTASFAPKTILLKVIRTTILNTMNPQNVDLFSDRDKVQKGIPFLYKKVYDHEGQPIRWPWRAEKYANYLIQHGLKVDWVTTPSGKQKRYAVSFKMKKPKNYKLRDAPYMNYVRQYSKRFGINEALILGIIQSESHFNPYATSSIPAYGLMQVVPASAGADAWAYLKGRAGRPSKRYLFNPKNNIEMGTAYLRMIFRQYLVKIKNLKSREYCTIAAYNTGSGNVLRAFSKNRDKAFKKINSMSPKAVYIHLKRHLPYKETRRYLVKVTKAKNAFY